jgi:hypothetical protein
VTWQEGYGHGPDEYEGDAAPPTPVHGTRGTCGICGGDIEYVEATAWNGYEVDVLDAWWAHRQHPADGHDAEIEGPA